MAIVFMDGFDHYADGQQLRKWDQELVADIDDESRTGVHAVSVFNGGRLGRNIVPALGSIIFGFALSVKEDELGSNSYGRVLRTFTGSSNLQVSLMYSQVDKLFRFTTGGSLNSASSINTYDISVGYVHVEAKITYNNATPANNTVELRINGITEIGGSLGTETLNTNPEGTGSMNMLQLATSAPIGGDLVNLLYDDFYLLNSTSPNNDFLGDVKIVTLHVDADTSGSLNDWTGSASPDWQQVDDTISLDDNATVITSSTNGQKSLFSMDTLSGMGAIKGIQISAVSRKDGAGDGDIKILTSPDNGTTLHKSSIITVNAHATNHKVLSQVQDVDPDTASAWTVANINTAEFGVEQIS